MSTSLEEKTSPQHAGGPYRVLQGKEKHLQTTVAFTQEDSCDFGRKRSQRLGYLEGVRGFLMVLSLIWCFFRLYAPAIVTDRGLDQVYPAAFLANAPSWQNTLRKVISPVFFNETFLASAFLFLGGRVGLTTFIERRNEDALAGAMFRRPFRLAIPSTLALVLTSILSVSGAFHWTPELSSALKNHAAAAPVIWESTLTFFNSALALLMTFDLRTNGRGASFLPPGNVAWIIAPLFQQTFTMAVMAYILPYAVLKWKIIGALVFGLAAFWSGRWAAYSTAAILLAEFAVAYAPLLSPSWTLRLFGRRITAVSHKFIPGFLLALGITLKYLWASFPERRDDELVARVDPTSGGLEYSYDPLRATPRLDDFFVVSGFFVLLELSPTLRSIFDRTVLKFAGSLAYASLLVSGSVMLALGSVLRHHLTTVVNTSEPVTLLVLFLTLIPAALVASAAWRFSVDDGSIWIARGLYRWVTR